MADHGGPVKNILSACYRGIKMNRIIEIELYPQACRDFAEEIGSMQSELRRLRIAHLRRMVYATLHVEERALRNARRFADAQRLYSVRERAIVGKMDRFRDACRAEIARLRGEG